MTAATKTEAVELSLADMELIIEALANHYKANPRDQKFIAITAKRMLEMRDQQIEMLKQIYS